MEAPLTAAPMQLNGYSIMEHSTMLIGMPCSINKDCMFGS